MSISVNGISHHMVSYYKVDDVKNSILPRPLSDPRLQNISVRPELYLKQNFRAPVEETEHYAIDGQMNAHPQMMYSSMAPGPYGVRPGQYFAGHQYPAMYGMPTSAASPYATVSGTSWSTPQPTAGAVAYGSHPGYTGQSYGPYYKTPVSQPGGTGVKTEDQNATSHSMAYGSQYTPSYPGMQRNGSQSTPNMVQPAYQTPVQQQPSTFGSMSARPSYGNTTMASPVANGQPQQSYPGATPQSYAVRSPSQSYGMHSAPPSAVPQSPHSSIKSPNPAAQGGGPPAPPMAGTDPQMPYRSSSYAVGGAPPSNNPGGDMNGLGISGTASYPAQAQPGQSYPAYGSSAMAAQSGGPYGQ